MHICLLPTETLFHIFAIIDADPGKNSRVTIAALARTCRTFKEPALDILWKNTNGFKPLLACLRPNARRIAKRKVTLARPLTLREWNIVGQYAQRIRSLTITSSRLNDIDDCVVQALISTPTPTPLFSSLCSLEWWDDRECFFPLLRTLLVPTIRSMKLSCASRVPCVWDPSFAKSALLASIGTRCPSIQELECAYSDNTQAICEFLGGWQELFHLWTGVINMQCLHHLASLPSLKSLHFRINDFGDGTHTDSTPSFVSPLDEVSITASTPFLFTRYLRNIRFTSCRSVELCIESGSSTDSMETPEPPSSLLDIPDLMNSFSECFSPVVEYISIDFSDPSNDELGQDPILRFDAVVPLLSFSRLTILDLDRFLTSTVDDAALKTMAQSWPHLEQFCFGSAARGLDSSSITFVGLVHLIQHCRHLRYFAMSFLACSIDIDCEPFSNTIPNDKITSIFVGISPIVDCIAVAGQLHALLPNLITVNATRIRSPLPPPFEDIRNEWSRVDEFLTVLTEGAKIREKIGRVSQECSLPG